MSYQKPVSDKATQNNLQNPYYAALPTHMQKLIDQRRERIQKADASTNKTSNTSPNMQ